MNSTAAHLQRRLRHLRASSTTGTINSSAFGLITATAAPRIGQLAVKFLFWRVPEHMEPVDATVRGAL